MPRVSIGIPAFNAAPFLAETLESVLAQDYPDYEVVVCDNASTDETADICARYAGPRLRYVRFEEHVGQPGNWNRCLRETTGEYVVLLHADDLLEPRFVGRAVAVLDAEPAIVLVSCAVQHFDSQGRDLSVQRLFLQDRIEKGEPFFERLLHDGCVIAPAGVMVRRCGYAAVGGFAEDVRWGADWDMWLRLSLAGDICYIAEPLAAYREHAGQGTVGVIAGAFNGPEERRVVERLFRDVPAAARLRPAHHAMAVARVAHRTWCWAEEACRLGLGGSARRGLLEAVKMDPRLLVQPRTWALWVASWVGYGLFARVKRVRQGMSGR